MQVALDLKLVEASYKDVLTVEETSKLFNMGVALIRKIINENPRATFVAYNGSKVLIHRKSFNDWFQQQTIIRKVNERI